MSDAAYARYAATLDEIRGQGLFKAERVTTQPITATVSGTRMSASAACTRVAMPATSMLVRPQVGQEITFT